MEKETKKTGKKEDIWVRFREDEKELLASLAAEATKTQRSRPAMIKFILQQRYKFLRGTAEAFGVTQEEEND